MPRIIDAFRRNSVKQAALHYSAEGFSVLPCKGKRPALSSWKQGQTVRANGHDIQNWHQQGFLQNVGIICGEISGNLVVIDLDGLDAVTAFHERFPDWMRQTLRIKTGSGRGEHLYFRVAEMPDNLNVRTDLGGFEIRGNGMYVIAPPSIHPDTNQLYKVEHFTDIAKVDNLLEISLWFNALKKKQDRKETTNNGAGSLEGNQSIAKPYSDKLRSSAQEKWAQAALDGEIKRVQSAGAGERNTTLNKAAFALGQLVGSNALDQARVESALVSAAASIGLVKDDGEHSVRKTIASGLLAGTLQPRSAPKTQHNGHMSENGHRKEKTYKPTDDILGQRFIEQSDGKYAYFREDWHKYESGQWQPDKRFRRGIWDVLIAAKTEGVRPSNGTVSSIESYVQLELMVDDDEIDAHENYINLQNGLYNLKTKKLEAHKREIYATSQLPFAYDAQAECPKFLMFLYDVLVDSEGDTDYGLLRVVQEAFGYSLTASTRHRVSFWLVGPSGSGKSTLLNVLIDLAGDSHVSIDLNELSNTNYQLADVAGKRVVTFTEPESGSVLADGHYKRLVSNDVIMARQPYGKPFRFRPVCKLWGAMNETPYIIDRSEAVYGRVMIIPMNHVIPVEKWDMQLYDKLKSELAGIFNWSLEGLIRLQKQGQFTLCDQIEAARSEYRQENDNEAAFVSEKLVLDPSGKIGAQELYNAYKTWCELNGMKSKGSRKVRKDWKRLGLTYNRTNYSMWEGAYLRN